MLPDPLLHERQVVASFRWQPRLCAVFRFLSLLAGRGCWLWLCLVGGAGRAEEWESESFALAALQVLDRLGEQCAATSADSESQPQAAVAELSAPEFTAVLPAPTGVTVHRDRQYWVRRAATSEVNVDQLSRFIAEQHRRLAHVQDPHFHFKIVDVQLADDRATTRAYVDVAGTVADGRWEQSSDWQVEWQRGDTESAIRLRRIAVSRLEEVETSATAGQPLLRERTAEIAGGTIAFQQQFALGQAEWQRRIEAFHGILNPAQNGISVADVNGDGRDDVYVCQPGGLPNRLWLHVPDGTVVDVSAAAGVDLLDDSHSSLAVDLDNDGDQDLVVASATALLIYLNDGVLNPGDSPLIPRFRLVQTIESVADAYSLCAADYDQDGDLDLFASVYFPSSADVHALPVPVPYFDARNGGRNHLLQNQGRGLLNDVTADVGLDVDNQRFSYACLWVDYDRDGDEDLYVANDFGPDNLFRNELPQRSSSGAVQFREVSQAMGISRGAFGMSVAAGDYNRDGYEDLYVANMFSSAGSRVTRQPNFRAGEPSERIERFQRLASGNSLYLNRPGQPFVDLGESLGVALGRWSWGANFVDLNNDGWQDLLVTNGYITGSDPDDL